MAEPTVGIDSSDGAVASGGDHGSDSIDSVVRAATALLRRRGDRMTGPRRVVLTALAQRQSHLSPEQVVSAVAELDPAVHRASVYRALETLSELGLVQHVHLGHGTTAYHLAVEHRHLHAACGRCGVVVDLPGDLLDDVATRLEHGSGFRLDPSHVALSGTCADCDSASP